MMQSLIFLTCCAVLSASPSPNLMHVAINRQCSDCKFSQFAPQRADDFYSVSHIFTVAPACQPSWAPTEPPNELPLLVASSDSVGSSRIFSELDAGDYITHSFLILSNEKFSSVLVNEKLVDSLRPVIYWPATLCLGSFFFCVFVCSLIVGLCSSWVFLFAVGYYCSHRMFILSVLFVLTYGIQLGGFLRLDFIVRCAFHLLQTIVQCEPHVRYWLINLGLSCLCISSLHLGCTFGSNYSVTIFAIIGSVEEDARELLHSTRNYFGFIALESCNQRRIECLDCEYESLVVNEIQSLSTTNNCDDARDDWWTPLRSTENPEPIVRVIVPTSIAQSGAEEDYALSPRSVAREDFPEIFVEVPAFRQYTVGFDSDRYLLRCDTPLAYLTEENHFFRDVSGLLKRHNLCPSPETARDLALELIRLCDVLLLDSSVDPPREFLSAVEAVADFHDGSVVNARDPCTLDCLLHVLCRLGHVDAVRKLLGNPELKVDQLDEQLCTSLTIVAMTHGNVDIARELVIRGAKCWVQNESGLSALDYANAARNKTLLDVFCVK